MIVTKLKEGLGNQLFQYFFTRSLKQEDYSFDISFYNFNSSRKLDLINFPNLNLKFITNPQDLYKDFIYIKDNFQYLYLNINKDQNYYFDGYWQNKDYLNSIRDLILEEMRPEEKLENYINEKYGFLRENSVSLHVRRSDYLMLSNYYYILDDVYYNKALNYFPKDIKIAVFSDDIEWCKLNFKNKNLYFIEESPSVDLRIMSMCENNIIANSTFSFWGAYLNQNKNKKIICPKNWFKPEYSLLISNNLEKDCSKNLILDNWIRI